LLTGQLLRLRCCLCCRLLRKLYFIALKIRCLPVAIVRIDRTSAHTEIRLQAQAALAKVCFAASGPNSPYLLASGRNYRYLGGDNVSTCPERRDYAASDVMVLRFEPLAAGNSTFSFVSGQGGEKQSIDAVSPNSPYWNFLRVILN